MVSARPTNDTANCTAEGDAFVTKLGPSGTMLYSSYLGGSDGDHGQGIAVDSSGNAYLTGSTGSADFPTKTPIQTTGSIFVTKINPAAAGAASLVYSTRLGNNGANLGGGIAVDSSGAAYVSGYTTATNFTTTAGVIRPTHTTTEGEGFVVKLNAAGTARVYATYIGGSGSDDTRRIVVDNAGNAAVIGDTTSTDLAIVNGAQAACGDSGCTLGDGFVLQLNATASAIRYSTYQGGSGIDYGIDLAVDTQGILYTTGYASSGFPVTLDAFRSVVSGFNDAYVTTLNPAGVGAASRVYSTLVGGNGDDLARGIAVDTAGNAYITGETESSDLATPGAAQTVYSGDQTAAFAAKIGITGRRISHTYDGLERLIGTVEAPGNSFAYTYDLAGNRTAVQVNGAAPVITTYNLANQITNAGYTYDLAGNLTNDGTATYTYDALNRTTARGGTTYAYNGDGVLVSQAASGVTTRYTQDLASPLTQVLQTFTGTPRTDYLYGANRLATLTSGVRTWYVSDALGSVRRTVTDAGVPLGVVQYDPWGSVESGAVPVFGFTGELQQGGDVYLRARWYNSAQGKFTTVDPAVGVAETPYSLHPYQYALSAPTTWIDPSGRCVFTGVDTLVCAGIVITVYEAVVFLVAAGMATYATYDACITRGGCNRLAADLQRYFDSPTDIDTPPATTGNETEYVLMPEGNEEGPEGDPSSKLGAGAKLAAGVTAATIIGGTVLAPACPPAAQDDDKRYTHQVLVVGEHASSFVYSQGLAARHPDWKVVGSDYGNGSNSQIVLPSMRNLTIVRNVDATRLHSGSYTGSRFFDNIIFNAPRATTKRFYEDTGKLINSFLRSALAVLKSGGAARISSSDGMPGGLRLNYLVNHPPSGYGASFKRRYELDDRFGIPYDILKNNGEPLYPPGRNRPQIYWFAFQKG